MKPLVSVLVPCYNHEEYIQDCLESILKITYPRIEVLIVDDASKDRTFLISKSYKERLEKKAERVIIERNEKNLGICKNCNRLWKLANGDYYKFIASDDFFMPDGISYLVEYFEKNPECNIVHGNAVIINKDDRFSSEITKVKSSRRSVPSGYNLTSYLLEKNFIYAPSAMISKATKEKFGIFSEEYVYEDREYWLRVSVEGKIDYINQNICAYRILESSAGHFTRNEKRRYVRFLIDGTRIFDFYKEYATKESIDKFYNGHIIEAYLCGSKKMIKEIKNRIRKNKVKLSARTWIWIFAYRTGIYKIYRYCKKLLIGYRKR